MGKTREDREREVKRARRTKKEGEWKGGEGAWGGPVGWRIARVVGKTREEEGTLDGRRLRRGTPFDPARVREYM